MLGPESRAEIIDQKPFVIRGHHLINFHLVQLYSPERVAAHERNKYTTLWRRLEEIPWWRSLKSSPDTPFVQKQMDYIQDVLGLSLESADEFEKRSIRIYETFLALPDDHPAEIVEGIPDALCETCAVGKHCRLLRIVPWNNAIKSDSACLDEFLKNINLLNLPESVISYEQAYFSDAEPQRVRRIKTTMGLVRKVLRDGDLKLLTDSVVQ